MGVSVFSFFSENWPFVSRRELIENWSVGPSSPAELRLCSPSFASGARGPFRFAQEDLFDVCNFDSLKRTQFHNPVISLFSFHLIMTFLKLVSLVC